jgi:hypothetical protein
VSKKSNVIAALLAVAFLGTAAAEDWPPLPKEGFISGRVATPAEAATGKAVFSAMVRGAPAKSTPIRIQIPQYAYYTLGGQRIPVIVLQAETVEILQGGKIVRMSMIGAIKPDGKGIIGLLTSFELLGTVPPR